jgi:cobalt ECF transporter T component CbiQ
VVALLALGLVTGGGDMGHAFGADWALVDWPSVATMLLVVALIAAIALPLAWRLLPGAVRGVGTAFVAAAIVAPLGLIAPGFAYGEGSTGEVQQAFGYVPSGLHDLSTIFSAPFAGYNLPLPFFADAKAALWQQAIGYEIAGILGIVALAAVMVAFGRILRQMQGPTDAERGDGHARTLAARARGRGHSHDGAGWAEHTIAGITGSVERTVFTEEHARRPGWLQRVDPRAKLAMFLAVVLAASLSGSFAVLVGLYAVVVLAAVASRVPLDFFIRRVWLGIPLFAGVIAIPAIFLVPGPRLFEIAVGPIVVAPSIPGLTGAVIFVARVAVSVSLAVLLVMTTPWADLLKSLQAIRVPRLFVLVLAMAYRYIFLFLHLTNGMFEARKSRMVGRTTGGEHRRWITGSMGNLLNRSFKMSGDVYAAMIARGFTGTIRTFQDYRMRAADWAALGGSAAVAIVALLLPRVLP